MNKDCNYADNYYGDQICQEAEQGQPQQVKKDCNYDDNYYGDQICQEDQPVPPTSS
ncbi:MAG: hypothetical protein AseanaTS_01370 [Candidatus Pelagadaptatus aseana]